jgi:acetolactate synthase I/II/III large subunit
MDYCRMQPCSIRALGDTALGIPELTRICRERIAGDTKLQARIKARSVAIGKRHDEVWAKWQEEARKNWDASPITFSRLALEVWEVIKDEDWVLTANNLKQQVRKLWDFDKPYRHPGVELGTSTQIGISLGVALAHKGTGRVVVDIQPDGDLMFDAGALWVAAKYQIPMLVVMHNNRAYYNDWEHQIRMARLRGTDEAKAHIGMDLFGPEPDFGALARAMGCYGEGPIDKPQEVRPALLRALAEVKKGRLALVDTITQHR